MKNRKRVFSLLSKKENISFRKAISKKNLLLKDLKKINETKKKLNEVIKETKQNNNEKTVNELKAENWYNTKIKDQLVEIDNKIDFLNKEIKNQNIILSNHKEKSKKYDEKYIEHRKNEITAIEKRNDELNQFKTLLRF